MPTTCLVCGATEEAGPDRTCPVCGADLPADDVSEFEPEPELHEDGDDETAVASSDEQAPPQSWPPPPPSSGPTTPPPADGPSSPPPWGDPATPPPSGGPATPPPSGGWPPAAAPPPATPPPHASGVPASMRTYGMLTHLSAFAGAIVALAFVGPLVMWLIRRDEHPFLDHHGTEALNFNLSMLLYGVIGIVATIATLGLGAVVVIPAVVVFFVTWVVCTIIGAVKANNGEGYRYPLTIRFVKER